VAAWPSLQLVDSEDPLEAGLEIIARPPGKKPQTMTLLSGGEQALTAMALIFAVFLTNPAPICVLDEVDAPLDDANVERFCDLIDEMARNRPRRASSSSPTIPITMARMDASPPAGSACTAEWPSAAANCFKRARSELMIASRSELLRPFAQRTGLRWAKRAVPEKGYLSLRL
jgi:hypothetical protein